jgi:hypothetical protein
VTRVDLPEPHAAALQWIVGALDGVPFQLTGGAAAWVHGARRPLADLDFDVPDAALPGLAAKLAPFVVWGPARYTAEGWDLDLLTLRWGGVDVDLAGAAGARVWDGSAWVSVATDLGGAERCVVAGVLVPVVGRAELIAYKRLLAREVDLADVAALTAR